MKRLVLFVLMISVLIYGCDKIFPPTPVDDMVPQVKQPQQMQLKIKGPLLAKVNNWAIGLDDFKVYLNNLKPLAATQNIDIESPEFKQRLLTDLVSTEILSQIAIEKGLDKGDDIVRAIRDTKSSLLAAKIRTDIEKTADVTYAELKTFYDQNKQFLKKPQEIRLREIVLESETQAREIYIRLLQGEDFSYLAQQYSQGDTAEEGGDLGYLAYDPELKFEKFWEVAVALDVGDISSIFKDDMENYYIVMAEDMRGGQEIPLTEVEEELKTGMKREKIEKEITKIIDGFKARAKVEINEDLIR